MIFRNMIMAVVLLTLTSVCGRAQDADADFKSIAAVRQDLNTLEACLTPVSQIKQQKITIFCSAAEKKDDPHFAATRELGKMLAQHGYCVVTGGGPGLMAAANQGVLEAGGTTIGCRIIFQKPEGDRRLLTHVYDFHTFHLRKLALQRSADAFIVQRGGYGTLDELFEILTLMQTQKMPLKPIIFYGKEFWQGMVDWLVQKVLANGLIQKSHLELFSVANTPEELLQQLQEKLPRTK